MERKKHEQLYLKDDEELQINRDDIPIQHIIRSINRYKKAFSLAGGKRGLWLDIGCGSGYGTKIASKHCDAIIGIDVDFKAITYARKHYASHKISFSFTPPSVKVDVILSLETIEHVNNPDQFIKTAQNLLKSDGVLVITTDKKEKNTTPSEYHVKEYTPKEVSTLLLRYFRVVIIHVDAPVLFLRGSMVSQMYAVAREPLR